MRVLLLCVLCLGCAAKKPAQVSVTRVVPKECIVGPIICLKDDCSRVKFVRIKACEVLSVERPEENRELPAPESTR